MVRLTPYLQICFFLEKFWCFFLEKFHALLEMFFYHINTFHTPFSQKNKYHLSEDTSTTTQWRAIWMRTFWMCIPSARRKRRFKGGENYVGFWRTRSEGFASQPISLCVTKLLLCRSVSPLLSFILIFNFFFMIGGIVDPTFVWVFEFWSLPMLILELGFT